MKAWTTIILCVLVPPVLAAEAGPATTGERYVADDMEIEILSDGTKVVRLVSRRSTTVQQFWAHTENPQHGCSPAVAAYGIPAPNPGGFRRSVPVRDIVYGGQFAQSPRCGMR